MITVTVSVISITAVIVGYAGVAAFTGVAKSKVSKCAASIKALIDVAANDDVVTMTFRYKCKEVWESDPSYSDIHSWLLLLRRKRSVLPHPLPVQGFSHIPA